MAKSLAIIVAIFGCGLIGTSFLVIEGEEIANSINDFVTTHFYHQTPNGKAFDFPSAYLGIGIGIFAVILAAAIFLVPKILKP